METETPQAKPILQIAWARFSELDVNALARSKSHLNKRVWIAVFSVLATLLALLGQVFEYNPRDPSSASLIGLIIYILLILTPLIGSSLAAFTKAFYANGDWLTMRAGAEEINLLQNLFCASPHGQPIAICIERLGECCQCRTNQRR